MMHIPPIDDITHKARENRPVESRNILKPSMEYLKKIFRLSTHIGNGLRSFFMTWVFLRGVFFKTPRIRGNIHVIKNGLRWILIENPPGRIHL